MTKDTPRKIRLSDAIAELRSEISRARREGEGNDVRFTAKEIEVELSLDFGWSAEAEAGASKWIPFVDLSASGSANQQSLHKVRLTLELNAGGDPSSGLISDSAGPAPVKR